MLIANPAALRQYNDRCKQINEQERHLKEVRRAWLALLPRSHCPLELAAPLWWA